MAVIQERNLLKGPPDLFREFLALKGFLGDSAQLGFDRNDALNRFARNLWNLNALGISTIAIVVTPLAIPEAEMEKIRRHYPELQTDSNGQFTFNVPCPEVNVPPGGEKQAVYTWNSYSVDIEIGRNEYVLTHIPPGDKVELIHIPLGAVVSMTAVPATPA